MSLTSVQLLAVQEALADKIALCDEIDYVLPSPVDFENKAGFWNCVAAKSTVKEIDQPLIRAVWLRYLKFETDNRAHHAPLYTLIFEFYIAHEHAYTRMDETGADDFLKRILQSNQEHLTAIFQLVGEFEDTQEITVAGVGILETVGLAQSDFTEIRTEVEFVPGIAASVSRLECRVNTRIEC